MADVTKADLEKLLLSKNNQVINLELAIVRLERELAEALTVEVKDLTAAEIKAAEKAAKE